MDVLCSVIHRSFYDKKMSEPQLVANFVWNLPIAINQLSLTGGITIESSGVFVHGQPYVKCKNFPESYPVSVEIGDMLLIRTEVNSGRVIDRRALLLQVKKVSSFPAKPDNANQHHLYAKWPAFEYVRSTARLNGQWRHVTGPDLYDATRFLLIAGCGCSLSHTSRLCNANYPCFCRIQTASPSLPELSHHRYFTIELFDFLLGDAGKPFHKPKHPSNKNWDRIIEDLTSVTAKQRSVFMSRSAGTGAQQRGQNLLLCLKHGMLRELWDLAPLQDVDAAAPPPEVPGEWTGGEDDRDGISIIEFVISREDTH